MLSETALAWAAIIISTIIFGTNFMTVKKVPTGDGIFFQLIVTSYIWFVGLIYSIIQDSTVMSPVPMIGGILWGAGNLAKVPIIKTIGIGIGQIIWASTNCVFGWAVARFGLFGSKVQSPSVVWLNYLGVCLTLASLLFFFAINSSGKNSQTHKCVNATMRRGDSVLIDEDQIETPLVRKELNDPDWIDELSQTKQKWLGVFLAVLSGAFYGMNFLPITLAVEQEIIKSHMDGVLSHFSGVLIAQLSIFIVYSVYRKNKPDLYPSAVIPAMITGTTWAVAFLCWLYANSILGEAFTFPILATAPSVLGCVVGIYFFKEVSDKKSIMLAVIGSLTCIAGVLCTSFSR